LGGKGGRKNAAEKGGAMVGEEMAPLKYIESGGEERGGGRLKQKHTEG